MEKKVLDEKSLQFLVDFQRNELTEHFIYIKLAAKIKDAGNKTVLERIGNEEKAHYNFFKTYTGKDINPDWLKVYFYYWVSILFGLTFGIKLMEKGEGNAQVSYAHLLKVVPEIQNIINDEEAHEKSLIDLIEEEKLDYIGSIVLGLNDALVELTGALAGLTFALQNTKLIALAGLITGIAASFSMAASDYLSKKSVNDASALKSALYTGTAYVITVVFLILPYLLFNQFMVCLMFTLVIAILIILGFNYYISIAKDLNFKKRFLEMAIISLSVSAITFGIGVLIRQFIVVDI